MILSFLLSCLTSTAALALERSPHPSRNHLTIRAFRRIFTTGLGCKSRWWFDYRIRSETRVMEALGARFEPGHASSQHTSEPEQPFRPPGERRLPNAEEIAAHGVADHDKQANANM